MEMQGPRPPTLDQLQVFLAIVETGSFAAAAKRLGRATSAASYAIANLESQLGIAVFDRVSTRKPQLTDAGRAILADARNMAAGLDGLLARSRGLLAGLEADVSLAVDVMVPTTVLVDVLDAFQSEFPTVPLRLHVEQPGGVAELVIDGRASVGIGGPPGSGGDELERVHLGAVPLIPVAAKGHPLARTGAPVTRAIAESHTQLVLSARASEGRGRDHAIAKRGAWQLADLGAQQAMLLAGAGWGRMPESMVRKDIADGRLVVLSGEDWEPLHYRLQSLHRRDVALGPARRWLVDRFTKADWRA